MCINNLIAFIFSKKIKLSSQMLCRNSFHKVKYKSILCVIAHLFNILLLTHLLAFKQEQWLLSMNDFLCISLFSELASSYKALYYRKHTNENLFMLENVESDLCVCFSDKFFSQTVFAWWVMYCNFMSIHVNAFILCAKVCLIFFLPGRKRVSFPSPCFIHSSAWA